MVNHHTSFWVLVPLTFAVGVLRAQEPTSQESDSKANSPPVAGHSMHGEAFNDGPRQAAHLMGGTGRVKFPITTANPRAQLFFDQGLGQLHGFWYWESERSFRHAAALDPDCAMAYWGMAAANVNNHRRASGFIRAASARQANCGRREQLYIQALASYYEDLDREEKTKKDKQAGEETATSGNDQQTDEGRKNESDDGKKASETKRKQKYLSDLEAIAAEFPDDIEAKALLANQRWAWRETIPIDDPEKVDALLDEVFKVEPIHPAHHYRIHLWDDVKAERALSSAARSGQSAPAIAHMWHMAGHTYSKLNRFEEAAWQQEASARVDHAYMHRDRVMPFRIHNYAHNNEWLVRSLLKVGRVQEAIDVAQNLRELPRHPKQNSTSKKDSAAGFGRDRLFDALVLYERWDDYARLAETDYLEFGSSPIEQIKRQRWLGAAHFSMKNQVQGGEQLAALQRTLADLKKGQDEAGEQAAAKAGEQANAGEAIQKAVDESRRPFDEQIKAADKAVAHLQGLKAFAAGDPKRGVELLEQAGDLSKVQLARAYSLAGEHERAIELAGKAMEEGKNEVYPAAIHVEVLDRAGKTDDVKKALANLRSLSSVIDRRAPIFDRVAEIAELHGYSGDWRMTQSSAASPSNRFGAVIGDLERLASQITDAQRPALAALGPLRWQPAPAYDFLLPNASGELVSLRLGYARRPVVLLFYLGSDCPHCIQQLNTFAPLARRFDEAGIALVAISAESIADLTRTVETMRSHGEPAIEVLSDQSLEVFKAYRAFDDFERAPLHGTFLLDGNALIRWQEIGAEPYTDAEFLLEEAKRLLALRQ
jgi:peroxiredoxin